MHDYPDWMKDPQRLGTGSRQEGHGGARHVQDKQLGVRASQIQRENVDWLWPGRLAIGKITILDGDPDVGKSTLTCDIGGALTTRAPLSGGHCLDKAAGVVFVNAEDGASDVIRPRLEAAGADLSKCVIVTPEEGPMIIPTTLDRLNYFVSLADVELVVIDPLFAYLPPGKNSWNDQHMREVLTPLKTWAEKMGVAVLIIRHPNKGKDMKAMYRGGGSIGIIGAARFGLFAAKHPEDSDLRVLSSSKCNIGRKSSSLAFRIVEDDANPEVGVVEWMGEIDLTADDLVGYGKPTNEREIDVAIAFLLGLLAGGPIKSTDVIERARKVRISKRTLDRAKYKLGVRSRKNGSQWYWELPTEPDYATNGVATDVPF